MAKKSEQHRGAWKVAYADFVTAMMALFVVLWIIKERPPKEEEVGKEVGTIDNKVSDQKDVGKTVSGGVGGGTGANSDLWTGIIGQMQKIVDTQEPDYQFLDVQLTEQGLEINLFDRSQKPLFKKDSAELTAWGRFVMEGLTWIIDRKNMQVSISGHTAKTPRGANGEDGHLWELSCQRASATRRALVGLGPEVVVRLSGKGDSAPLAKFPEGAEENNRITLNLQSLK